MLTPFKKTIVSKIRLGCAAACFSSDFNSQKGYSFIELMIAFVIFGVVLALGVPSYRVWIQNSHIRTAAESIQNGLQVARAEAVKRNARVQFSLGLNSAWTVGCTPAIPDNDGDGIEDCPAVIQSRIAKEGSSASITVITVPVGSNIVEFNNFGRVNAAPVPFTQVDLDSAALAAADSRNLRITLGVGGNVRMCDPEPTLPLTDPRRCQ